MNIKEFDEDELGLRDTLWITSVSDTEARSLTSRRLLTGLFRTLIAKGVLTLDECVEIAESELGPIKHQ